MKPTLSLFILSLCYTHLLGQTQVCVPGEPPAEDCLFACVNCNFTGAGGSTAVTTGSGVAGFCGILTNDQWLGFIAGGTSATFAATPFGCQTGDGIQIALYADCYDNPLDCNGGCPGCGLLPLQLENVPLIIGQTYFLVVDGYVGDVCGFSVSATPVSAVQAPPVGSIQPLQGPNKICPNGSGVYTIPQTVIGAETFTWKAPPGSLINGNPPPYTVDAADGYTVTVTFGNSGGAVSVQGLNACRIGNVQAINVTVAPIPPTILPTWTVCPKAYPLTLPWGEIVQSAPPGIRNYTYVYSTAIGCDSTIRLGVVTTAPPQTSLLIKYLCENDSLEVCGKYYKNPGNYSVTCTNWKGCDSIVLFTIVRTVAEVKGGGSLNCFNGAVPLEAVGANGTAVWKNQTGDVVGTDKMYTATAAGTYTLFWTSTAGGKVCTSIKNIVIKEIDTLRLAIVPPPVLTCAATTATIQVNPSMPANVVWSGPAILNTNQALATVTQPGVYKATATTSGGCTATTSIVVVQNIAPPNILNATAVTNCTNNTIKLDVVLAAPQPPVTYKWTGPNGYTSNLKSPTVVLAGTYTIAVTNSVNGCTQSKTVTAFHNPITPIVTANGGIINCLRPSVTLSVDAGSLTNPVVQWTGPNGFISNQAAPTTTSPGIYTAFITDPATGCTGTDTALVLLDAQVVTVAATGGELSCLKNSVELSAQPSSALVLYQWSGPGGFSANIQNPVARVPGTYQVIVTNPFNGCSAAAAVTVTFNPGGALQASISGNGTLSCVDPVITLTASLPIPASGYLWTGPNGFTSTQGQIEATIPGVYQVTVTGVNGCTGTASVSIQADATIPEASINGGNIICNQPAVLTAVSNTPGATFTWSGPGGFTASQAQITVPAPGFYQVTVTGVNGCTNSASALVRQFGPAIISSIGSDTLTCSHPTTTLMPVLSAPVTAYQWIGPSGFTAASAQPVVVMPGDYELTVTDANGCTSSAAVTVLADITPPAVAINGVGLIFCDRPAVLTATSNIPSASFAWSGPNNFTSAQAQVMVTIKGTYQVTVTNPANGCTNSAGTQVELFSPPVIQSIQGGTLTCAQTSIKLVPVVNVPVASYLWSGPNGFSSTQAEPTVTTPGTYQLSAVGVNSCTQTISYTVPANTTLPSAQAIGGVLGCNPPVLSLNCTTNVSNATFAWSGPHGFLSNIRNPMVNRSGIYYVTVTNTINGCTRSANTTVFDNGNAPQAFLTIEFIGAGRRRIACFTTAVVPAFAWTGPSGFTSTEQNPVVIIPGLYTVLVTDGISDCQTYESILVPAATSANGKATGGRAAPAGEGWHLYPNPSPGQVQLRYAGDARPGLTYATVLDALGRIVAEQDFSDATEATMDLSDLPEGLYRILLQNDQSTEAKSFSIQR